MVRSPSRLAVRMIRQAISPRLAMRTDANMRSLRPCPFTGRDYHVPARRAAGAGAAAAGGGAAAGGSVFMMLTGGIDDADGNMIPDAGAGFVGAAAVGVPGRVRLGHAAALRATRPSNSRSLRLARTRLGSDNLSSASHLLAVQPSRTLSTWARKPNRSA